jgi:hypothetical protein
MDLLWFFCLFSESGTGGRGGSIYNISQQAVADILDSWAVQKRKERKRETTDRKMQGIGQDLIELVPSVNATKKGQVR